MLRFAPRLVRAGYAPEGALVEPLIENPPRSPLGEHELVPQVAWMVERDGAFEHVPASERGGLEMMRGAAELTKLGSELSNEALEELPGVTIATTGDYAAELLLDRDHLAALHGILGSRVYLAGAPRRRRLLVGGVGAGLAGMRAFVDRVPREHEERPARSGSAPSRCSCATTAVVGELQLAALAQAASAR